MKVFKKIVALLLVSVMALVPLAIGAAAEGGVSVLSETPTYSDTPIAYLNVTYALGNTSYTKAVSPAEIFRFSIARTALQDAAADVTVENMPIPTVGEVEFGAGAAGNSDQTKSTKKLAITLPQYTSVGIYTYTITPTAGTTLGVTYHNNTIKLVVTVIQEASGKIRVAAVHAENNIGSDRKSDTITVTYTAAPLTVKKLVTGQLGDQAKEFEVDVTFKIPEGMTAGGIIDYVDSNVSGQITSTSWHATDTTATVTIKVKHDEEVVFDNVPQGLQFTVNEHDYTSEQNGKYDAETYTINGAGSGNATDGATGTMADAAVTVEITNNKGASVDTGISLDSLPYVLLLAFAGIGAGAFFVKKRAERE